MLNFIYYPVSWIMWVWHWVFDAILPNSPNWDGIAWGLSVVFLVFTLRAILYKPFVKQIQTTKKMQEIQPQMQALRKKYAKDRVKMSEEMQKLQREHGFNPLLGCLPMFMQIPVFIGLFHVLRSFNRMGTGMGQLHMTAEQTRSIGNYAFSADQVQNFLDSRLFGVPLSAAINQPKTEWAAFVQPGHPIDFTRWDIVYLAVPLMILSSIATHMNARASVARQTPEALENQQTRIMNQLSLWIFPIGILVSGLFFPVAILLYWMSNNIWTYGQQHIVFGRMAKEEEAAKAAKAEKLRANAPKPGVKPGRQKKPLVADATGSKNDAAAKDDVTDVDDAAGKGAGKNGVAKNSVAKNSGGKADPAKSGTGDSAADDATDRVSTDTESATPAPKKPAPGSRPAGQNKRPNQNQNQRKRKKRR